MVRPLPVLAVAVALVPAGGCFLSTDTSNTTVTSPTLLTVDPSTFQDGVRCAPDEWRLYSVTLTDVTPPLAGFEPPIPVPTTSGLIPCNEPVMFAGGNDQLDAGRPLEIGHFYIAKIDGYDTEDVELVAVDAGIMAPRRISSKQPLLPRWTTTCGDPFPPSIADAGAPAQDGATTDGAAAVGINQLRRPTFVADSVSIRLQGCVPFDRSIAPQPPDAAVDAAILLDASAEGGG